MAEPWRARSRAGRWPVRRRAGPHALPVRPLAIADALAARLRDWAVARFLAWLAAAFGPGIALYFAAEREPALWAAGLAAAGALLGVAATRGRGYSALVALAFAALAAGRGRRSRAPSRGRRLGHHPDASARH